MSHRALRRMRQEREPQLLVGGDGSDSNSDDSDDDDEAVASFSKPSNAFAIMGGDDDDSSSSEDDNEEDAASGAPSKKEKEKTPQVVVAANRSSNSTSTDDQQVEDLDALLQEYTLKDKQEGKLSTAAATGTASSFPNHNYYRIITAGMDPRDLDIDHVMRTSLMMGSTEETSSSNNLKARSTRRGGNRQIQMFGPPKEEWPRPPHYVGGGMGMATYGDLEKDDDILLELPWPYSDMKESDPRCPPTSQWYQFTFSDSYQRDLQDFEMIQASGDANALAMFVAHHPFVVPALLQLSEVLYQTRHNPEGMALLKRALYISECAALNSFLKMEGDDGRIAFMDYTVEQNQAFFHALFRLMRISHVGGLYRTALAASRLLLSLDPLGDPKHVLLSLDHFALSCQTVACDEWLVRLVESNKVSIAWEHEQLEEVLECELLDMPNWAFSYALALFRIHQRDITDESTKEKADQAIQTALLRFPTVVGELLEKNEVNLNSRSFQNDWPSVMEYVNEVIHEVQLIVSPSTIRAYHMIVQIFVQQNFNFWSSAAVQKWIYDNLQTIKAAHTKDVQFTQLSPAMERYSRCHPNDFADKFQTMPAEANPLDPNAIAFALTIDSNRPRLIQRGQRDHRQQLVVANGENAGVVEEDTARAMAEQHLDADLVSSCEYVGEGGKHALFAFDSRQEGESQQGSIWSGKLLRVNKCLLRVAERVCRLDEAAAPFGRQKAIVDNDEPLVYIKHVVAPYLHPFADVPIVIPLDWPVLRALKKEAVLSGRIPTSRQSDWKTREQDEKQIDFDFQPAGTLVVDYRNKLLSSVEPKMMSFTIELKPKGGYLAFSPLVDPNHRIKYQQSRFKSLQQLQQQGLWTKGWAKGPKLGIVEMSLYEPLDLFSGDTSRIRQAVAALVRVPQNNLRAWCDGINFWPPERDQLIQALVVSILSADHGQDLLRRLEQWQRLDVLDVDGAMLVSQRLAELCESKEAAYDLLDRILLENIRLVGDDVITTPAIPGLEASPFRCDQMAFEEQESLRTFCQRILEFHDRLLAVQSAAQRDFSKAAVYMDSTREELSLMIQNDLSVSACVFLLRNWLLSLMMCDVSIFISAEECPESDAERNQNAEVVTVSRDGVPVFFRYSLHIIDVDQKPAKKLDGRSKAEAAFRYLT